MIKQCVVLLTVAAVCSAAGYSKTNHFSKKNTFEEQSKFASVASFHSTKIAQPQPAQPQLKIEQAPIAQEPIVQTAIHYAEPQPQVFEAPIPYAQPEPQIAPSPYSFGYEAEGSSRQESSDASGKVKGSYKVTNEDGSVRVVNYVADENGFRADIDTNEPGTKSDNPANVVLKSAAVEKPYVAPAPSMYAAKGYSQKTSKTHHTQFVAPVVTQQKQTHSFAPTSTHQKQPQFIAPVVTQQKQTHSFAQASSIKTKPQITHYAPKPFQQEKIVQTSISDTKPVPYAFSYDAQLEDGSSSRSESSDASGKVTGQYSLTGPDGSKRIVKYEADHEGFRATVDTNEFGTHSDSPANTQFHSSSNQEAPASPMSYASKKSPSTFKVEQVKLSSGSIKTAHQAPVMTYSGQPSIQYASPAVQEQPQPYSFSYSEDLDDGSIARSESADGSGKVIGSYSLSVADGRKRTVDYLADHDGFRATINTNEFGTKADSPANVQFYSSATEDEPAPYSSPNKYKSASSSMYSQSAIQQEPIQFSLGAAPEPRAPVAYKMPAPTAHQSTGAVNFVSKTSHIEQQRVEPAQNFVPVPYAFNYEAEASGGSSSRKESSDSNGVVTGSYKVRNEDGSVRVVEYIADKDGFRANVKTNEAGTKSDNPADVILKSDAPAAPLEHRFIKEDFPAQTQHTHKTTKFTQQHIEPFRR